MQKHSLELLINMLYLSFEKEFLEDAKSVQKLIKDIHEEDVSIEEIQEVLDELPREEIQTYKYLTA